MTDRIPYEQVLDRLATLHASPSWEAMDPDARLAFDARFYDPLAWADLDDATRDVIRRGELEVAAGLSTGLADPVNWGDALAIDAAVDAEDHEALDRELARVGHGYGEPVEFDPGTAGMYERDDDDDGDGAKALGLDPDGEGWVGL